MRSFADLIETVTAAATTAAERNLVTSATVKTALRINDTNSDALIADLIPRVSQLVTDHCRLARDAAGNAPTFARETLRATWYARPYAGHGSVCRGCHLYLPWRLPLHTIDSVVENGATLTAGTDYVVTGARPAKLQRQSGDCAIDWSPAKIVVTFKAGFAPTMSDSIDKAIEAAVVEQLRGWVFGADRDPNVRSVNSPDIGAESYSVTGGDVLGAFVLYPQVRDMLASWRNPVP